MRRNVRTHALWLAALRRSNHLDRGRDAASAGKVNPHVSTTGTDSDFIVKLVDAYPTATRRLLRPPANPSAPTP